MEEKVQSANHHLVKKGDVIVVWFSCGAASAVAAKKTIEKYGNIATILVVNNSIQEEDSDNLRFLKDIEKWIGMGISHAVNRNYPDGSCETVWVGRKYMSNRYGAVCTKTLKKEARQQWEEENNFDWIVMGFTSNEKSRSERFSKYERENLLPVLIDENINKGDCFKIIQDAGIKLPDMYLLGYPNANCIGCVKASSPTYWNHVRKVHPEVFKRRADLSRRLGAKLVRYKGKRIFLDELPPDAKGRPMKNMNFECGIFCEEKPRKNKP